MKLSRVRVGTQVTLAQLEGEGAFALQVDVGEPGPDPLLQWLADGRPQPTGTVMTYSPEGLLAPVRAPQKIVAVGLNYRGHASEQGKDLPAAPLMFAKSPGSIIGNLDPITFSRSLSQSVDYEAELAVVIGRTARNVSEDEALDYVLGYTICNDVSARDAQKADGQYFRAKSFDTFCPLGPVIVTADEIPDPQNLAIRTRVNGEMRQDGTTADMIFGVAATISYASRFFTLAPGDVITTGTPAGVGNALDPPQFLNDGDTVEIEIEGIGTLTNPVVVTD